MAEPYTDIDVELVAQTFIAEAKKNPVDTSHYLWGSTSRLLMGPNEFDIARAVLSALAAAGRLTPAGGETVWQYALPDRDGVPVPLVGTPRIITGHMVRRPLAPVGPWLPADTEGDIP